VDIPIHIVIVGGGTAGWMAANLFVKAWPESVVKVSLIESPDIGIIGVGEGSTPSLKRFFKTIEVAEEEWMPQCNATYKTNIKFSGWSPASTLQEYDHPFVSQLDIFTKSAFFSNCLTRRLHGKVTTNPGSFFLNGFLAKQGKSPVVPANFPFDMQYGYHFDSYLLGNFLRDVGIQRGVIHIQDRVLKANINDFEHIDTLLTEKNGILDADFFIDCSGFASVLMQKTLGVKFKDFKENLFNDSAVVMPTKMPHKIPVETQSIALSAGWCWKIPLRTRFGNGYVFSSDFLSPEKAEIEFRNFLGAEAAENECRHLKMRVGQLEFHWKNNCVGIGLSQGFIEPLEATALHLVQGCIELFIEKFNAGKFTNAERDDFNKKTSERFDRVRDYIVAHYKLNTRDDSEYWRENRNNMKLSESLFQILDTWYRRRDLTVEIEQQKIASHFGAESWHCLLAGYDAFPIFKSSNDYLKDLHKLQKINYFFEGCALNFRFHCQSLNYQIEPG